MGRIEHPHLIRVHHLNRNGVHLRDVKRWLADLRGKDMPDVFAWSYKRRYKNGYIWQDLLDDDLITPISDNEYVLKGSLISPSSPFPFDLFSQSNASVEKQEANEPLKEKEEKAIDTNVDLTRKESSCDSDKRDSPTRFEYEITSTLTDGSIVDEETQLKPLNVHEQKDQPNHDSSSSSSTIYAVLMNKSNDRKDEENTNNIKSATKTSRKTEVALESPSYAKWNRCSSRSGASTVFRNLMKCGKVDTDDAATVIIKRTPYRASIKSKKKLDYKAAINTKREKLGEPTRMFGIDPSNQQHRHQHKDCKSFNGMEDSKKTNSSFCNQSFTSDAFKPIATPNCSQCGKPFKPEKMHAHMKSCKGMKALKKSGSAMEKASSQMFMNSPQEEALSGYFLTH